MSNSYDSNGNLTGISSDATYGYSWDAEGKPVSITRSGSTVNLTYDALGRMVEQNRGGSYTQVVYGPNGSKLALMNGSTLQKVFVPLPAGAQAVYNASGLAYYRHADWLGSSRLASTPSRTLYYDGAYAPYGESYSETGTTDRDFTGQNQDTHSGLYDFMYREYHPVSGRWSSPDPAGLAAVDLTNPQSWNRYVYVMNNPIIFIDPLGLDEGGVLDICMDRWYAVILDCPELPGNGGLVWFPLPISIGAGDGGGGTGGSTGTGSGPNTGGLPPMGGETLGFPNWFPFPQGNIWDVLLPGDVGCDFGVCGDVMVDFTSPAQGMRFPWTDLIKYRKVFTLRFGNPFTGRACLDIDFGDHGPGTITVHCWDWSKKVPRRPGIQLNVPVRIPGPLPIMVNPCYFVPTLPSCKIAPSAGPA
jgi:RHS repeat-associated protein